MLCPVPRTLNLGGLSDASIQWPCGEGGKVDVTDTTERLRAGTLRFPPRKGTLPWACLPAEDKRPHSTGVWRSWQGQG